MSTTKFRRWVAARFECCVPTCSRPADPHHLKRKGMGGRADENAIDIENVAPLCRRHHEEIHAWGDERFARRYGVDLWSIARDIWAHWLRERDTVHVPGYAEDMAY